jgi:hemoglobin-like flavoprotein
MTSRQIELVQSSFKSVRPILEKATLMFYDRLFELDPSLRKLFHTAREEQARKLADMLVVVVDGLNRPEEILGRVEELGLRHVGYGVRPQHYTTVGEALLWTLRTGLGEAFTPEIEDAWNCAYMFLTSAMQNANSARSSHSAG